jgi:hypothetical protein
VGQLLRDYTAQYPRRVSPSYSSPREPEISLSNGRIEQFDTACHWTRSWASSITFHPNKPFPTLHLNVILPSSPSCSKYQLSKRFSHQNSVCISRHSHSRHMSSPLQPPRFHCPNSTRRSS